MHKNESDDAILSYVYDKLSFSEPVIGYHTVSNGNGCYVVLSNHINGRPKYVGWFRATPVYDHPDNHWVYRGEYDGLHIYQTADDDKPDSVMITKI